ncbi:hypothetical protein HG530_007737 [Fusarium avenaceum]|nr:hypothetical protein HG530_007737 [Fusarium avenaceum]
MVLKPGHTWHGIRVNLSSDDAGHVRPRHVHARNGTSDIVHSIMSRWNADTSAVDQRAEDFNEAAAWLVKAERRDAWVKKILLDFLGVTKMHAAWSGLASFPIVDDWVLTIKRHKRRSGLKNGEKNNRRPMVLLQNNRDDGSRADTEVDKRLTRRKVNATWQKRSKAAHELLNPAQKLLVASIELVAENDALLTHKGAEDKCPCELEHCCSVDLVLLTERL